ncbi:MAG: hypothetical protein DRI79_09625 [Chloroflexi bacterium]|nr:MAG: hypothetical protein DRI80_13940 [Chloroflexota bacterium]RLC86755.1 MAG: hypothetical protein DRI79_09625 [Chloroflexota bacterium]
MRFLADMGISPRSVKYLRGLGYDAVHLWEEGLDRLTDGEVMAKARREGRVVLTHDLDFGELLAASGAELPSVVIFRLRDMRPGMVNRYLWEVIRRYGEMLEEGAIVSVREGQIRVRGLPIQAKE